MCWLRRLDLRLPGRAGRLLDLTLAYVRAFLDADVKLLDPVGRLDNLLREVQRDVDAAPDCPHDNDAAGYCPDRSLAASWAAAEG